MKKFTIFTIMFALVFSLSAQITRAPHGALIKASELGLKSKSLHEIKQNKNFENWLWLSDIGINIAGGDEGFFTTYSQPIWPDSTVVTISATSGSNPVWMHSIAAIFDARSQAYEEYLDYQLVEDYEPYVVHAIMVPAWYDFRNGQFDKLRIEVGAANIENESAFTGVMLGEDITFASMNVSVEMPNSGKSLRDGDNIAALSVEHTGPWKDNLPTGFTSNITDNDYGPTNEGAAAFKATDKYIMVEFDSEAEEVEYRLKGMGNDGTWEGTFSVSESANGTDWTTVETITELSTTDFSDHNSNLNSNSRFIKFNFDNKVSGYNVALSKIAISKATTTPVEYAVTFAVEGDNGTIAATVDGNSITSGDDIEENKEVVFTANPADGFQVKEWTINGDVVADNTTNTLNVTVTEEITVKVEFEAETETPVEYAVTFAVEGDNGAIVATVDETEIDSGDLVEAGKDVVFTATPEDGFQVKEWTINGDVVADNTTNTLNVTVTEEITVKVEFEAEEEEEVLTRPVAEWSYSEKIVFDYVLTAEDVMSEEGYAQEIVIELPQPITVQPGEVLGFNLTFIPTAEYETGDTLQVYGGETPNKLNSFLFFYLSDDADEPSFHDPLGFNIFQFTHMYTLYQTFDNQLLNQIFYPEVYGSALIGFYAEQIVGIEEADNSSISVYPNPAESVVNVKLNSNETAKISIINIVGQTVQTVSTNMTQNTFDVSNLDAGIYLVRVEQSGIVYTKKVVVK
ncbi:MAG: T9SS type A sorting domain-containing protein [Bacteroidales bacterium]